MELYLRYLTPLHEGLMGMFPRHNDCRMGFYLQQSVLLLWDAIEHIEAVAGELAGVAQTGEMVAGIGDDIELVVGRGHLPDTHALVAVVKVVERCTVDECRIVVAQCLRLMPLSWGIPSVVLARCLSSASAVVEKCFLVHVVC